MLGWSDWDGGRHLVQKVRRASATRGTAGIATAGVLILAVQGGLLHLTVSHLLRSPDDTFHLPAPPGVAPAAAAPLQVPSLRLTDPPQETSSDVEGRPELRQRGDRPTVDPPAHSHASSATSRESRSERRQALPPAPAGPTKSPGNATGKDIPPPVRTDAPSEDPSRPADGTQDSSEMNEPERPDQIEQTEQTQQTDCRRAVRPQNAGQSSANPGGDAPGSPPEDHAHLRTEPPAKLTDDGRALPQEAGCRRPVPG